MENAADALKMAGSVLMFIIALSISIVSFGQVRETADIILDNADKETYYIDSNFYYPVENEAGTGRIVGLETVIPTVMRVFNESYRINFVFKNGDNGPIYKKIAKNNTKEQSDVNDPSRANLYVSDGGYIKSWVLDNDLGDIKGGIEGKDLFIKMILYGKDCINYAKFDEIYNKYEDDKLIFDDIKPLYERLQGKKITEYAGIVTANTNSDIPDSNSDIPEINRNDERVITYVVE